MGWLVVRSILYVACCVLLLSMHCSVGCVLVLLFVGLLGGSYVACCLVLCAMFVCCTRAKALLAAEVGQPGVHQVPKEFPPRRRLVAGQAWALSNGPNWAQRKKL